MALSEEVLFVTDKQNVYILPACFSVKIDIERERKREGGWKENTSG